MAGRHRRPAAHAQRTRQASGVVSGVALLALAGFSAAAPPAGAASSAPSWPGTYFVLGASQTPSQDVASWQAQMVRLGYRLRVTGIYGPSSALAATRLERSRGLGIDVPGIVGPQVWSAAFAATQPPTTTTTATTPPATTTSAPTGWTPPPPAVVPGLVSGGWVPSTAPVAPPPPATALTTADAATYLPATLMWQQLLVHRGYPIAIDGYFGPQTAAATSAFTRALGLAASASVGPAVWQAGFAQQGSGPGADTAAGGLNAQLMRLAGYQQGAPYQWAGAGPDSFDCSGLVTYVAAQLGWTLPHNAQAQYDSVSHVAVADMIPGDLVFFPDSTGAIFHVGIYAGNGRMWDAPYPGATVGLRTIWTTDILAGRLG